VGTGDFANVFGHLKQGLEEPLKGMGTAFSSSLFGLGGSLILGFVDIQSGHAQNRFFNEMEEWLTGVTLLVETDETSKRTIDHSVAALNDIDNNLKIMIKQIHKNNQVMVHLLKQQTKPPGDNPDPKK